MSEEERDRLFDLHRAATEAVHSASNGWITWAEMHAADDKFRAALYAIELNP